MKPEERAVDFSRPILTGLLKAYKWTKEKKRHEFKMGDIRHLLNHTEYANFNVLPMFGGLVYKRDMTYGLNHDRIDEFIVGKRTVPARVWKSNKGNPTKPEEGITIRQVKGIEKLLEPDGRFKVEYRHAEEGQQSL